MCFYFVFFLAKFSSTIKLNVRYIPSEANPADNFSRHPVGMASIYKVGASGVSDIVSTLYNRTLALSDTAKSLEVGEASSAAINLFSN